MLIGIHTSIGRGYAASIEEGELSGAEVIQIFVRQNLSWNKKIITEEEINEFKTKLKSSSQIRKVIAHSSYLINLASDDRTTIERSVSIMSDELIICNKLGIDIYVMHPGSHKGLGVSVGIQKIIDGLKLVREKIGDINVSVAFETTAGSGNQIGSNLIELEEIIKRSERILKSALCIDTAHLFGSGYNLSEEDEYERLIREIQENIGLERLLVCHMNDSKVGLASKKDRHEHIGRGKIGVSVFKKILKDNRIKDALAILETPKETNENGISYDRINIEFLKSLRDE